MKNINEAFDKMINYILETQKEKEEMSFKKSLKKSMNKKKPKKSTTKKDRCC